MLNLPEYYSLLVSCLQIFSSYSLMTPFNLKNFIWQSHIFWTTIIWTFSLLIQYKITDNFLFFFISFLLLTCTFRFQIHYLHSHWFFWLILLATKAFFWYFNITISIFKSRIYLFLVISKIFLQYWNSSFGFLKIIEFSLKWLFSILSEFLCI